MKKRAAECQNCPPAGAQSSWSMSQLAIGRSGTSCATLVPSRPRFESRHLSFFHLFCPNLFFPFPCVATPPPLSLSTPPPSLSFSLGPYTRQNGMLFCAHRTSRAGASALAADHRWAGGDGGRDGKREWKGACVERERMFRVFPAESVRNLTAHIAPRSARNSRFRNFVHPAIYPVIFIKIKIIKIRSIIRESARLECSAGLICARLPESRPARPARQRPVRPGKGPSGPAKKT